ncbi:HalOD1 output domain-containing protein [Halorussus halophilus]|uniref:HalOD1 output domain-containing protein n=1 Tax=Halorussus halophilus TaxID=2650975 RepID=UPI00130185A2|nr:HalOD1 output domain-containing protein [Halorussus halophilus]
MRKNQPIHNDANTVGSDPWVADKVGYDPQTKSYHTRHDWESDEPISLTVVRTIAVAAGSSPETMEPLYSVINPDELEALLSSAGETDIEVQFTYDRWPVTVSNSGDIIVHEPI